MYLFIQGQSIAFPQVVPVLSAFLTIYIATFKTFQVYYLAGTLTTILYGRPAFLSPILQLVTGTEAKRIEQPGDPRLHPRQLQRKVESDVKV